jgi:hypothetical protein
VSWCHVECPCCAAVFLWEPFCRHHPSSCSCGCLLCGRPNRVTKSTET